MASIHGIVYVIVGATVAIVSDALDYERFILFFWIGILLFGVGMFKLMLSFIRLQVRRRAEKSRKHQPQAGSQLSGGGHHQQASGQAAQQTVPRCQNCGHQVHQNFFFCPFCGIRLR